MLIGLWVKEHDFMSPEAEPLNEYSKFDPQAIQSPLLDNIIGGADKLKTYKELLASETITQEEFDAKKKQFLGLQMGDRRTVIKGTPQKNISASIVMFVGIVILLTSFSYFLLEIVQAMRGYAFSRTYFIFRSFMIFVGVIVTIVGVVIKVNTEKCAITVTYNAVSGRQSCGNNVCIPLNKITAIKPCSFNGISIASIGNASNFYCFENRDELMKAIAFLLSDPQQAIIHAPQAPGCRFATETERLKSFKDLLDAGVLTQEEFDAKKKQVLRL